MNAAPEINVREVTVEYSQGHKRTLALKDVSLDIPVGQVTIVVGGDGAGKTTLLSTVVGRIIPNSGSVHAPSDIGYMPSTSGVWPDLTVDENMAFVSSAYGIKREEQTQRTEELLIRAGLMDARDRLASRLSGGMRQKLGACMALVHQPRLLVLDEPTTGVDPVSRVELWRLVAESAAHGTAVVMSTTYLDEAERAHSILVLDQGHALYSGDPLKASSHVPGRIVQVEQPNELSWRRGVTFHAFDPTGTTSGQSIEPDLEDCVIAMTLARDASHNNTNPDSLPPRTIDSSSTPVHVLGAVKRFGAFTAVNDVDVDIHAGEVVGLLGANGAGKTTLIRMILGLEFADSGTITLFGTPPSRKARARIGYVPQGMGLYGDLTVQQNVDFVAAAYHIAHPRPLPDDLAAISDRLVERIGLGAQRRLAFHIALLHEPELLILDEPTSGVDALGASRLWDIIHDQADGGVGVLVTTHNMREAEQCDRSVMMSSGEVIASGNEKDIIGDTQVLEVHSEEWSQVFDAFLNESLAVSLAGRDVRVAGSNTQQVQDILSTHHLQARVNSVPATLEEKLLLASKDRADALTQ